MRTIITLLAVTLCSTMASARDYVIDTDIPYTSKADDYSRSRLKLDVYHPDSAVGAPVVVWFHGGGLTSGQKEIPQGLRDAGIVVVGVNYRLVPQVEVADCIDDAAEAVAWTLANIDRYGGDPSQVFVAGHSAGGFLTSMVGLDKSRLARYGVDADTLAGLISLSGQVITHFADRRSHGIGELTPTIDSNAPPLPRAPRRSTLHHHHRRRRDGTLRSL